MSHPFEKELRYSQTGLTRRDMMGMGIVGAGLTTMSVAPLRAQEDIKVRSYTLTAQEIVGAIRTNPSQKTNLIGINNNFEAPILRIKHGQELNAELINNTTLPINIHWHGIRHSIVADGKGVLSQSPIEPKGKGSWRFTPPDAGFFMFRPHLIGKSTELCAKGLTGALIVEEKNAPTVDHDLCFIMQDWLLDEQNQLMPFDNTATKAAGGRLGNVLTVNSKPIPDKLTFAAGSRLRIRLGNGCVSRILRLRFDDLKVFVAAIDGQPTDTFEPLRSTLPFPPGSRYDLLIDLPSEERKRGFITAMIGSGTPLITLETSSESILKKRAALPAVQPLPVNSLLPAGIRLQNAIRSDLTIEGGIKITSDGKLDQSNIDMTKPWRMNGEASSPLRKPLFTAKQGQPIVITVANKTDWAQPLHLHGHVFRLLHPYDDGWEPYWIDTWHMPEQRTLRMAFTADQVGRWLISSTNLDRFDAGLWHWFEVT